MLLKRMSQNRKEIDLRNQAGFTLIEIIAVLVILSILAVVAVPRYFDLQAQAKTRAMEGAMAEAIGRINGYFAQQLLSGALPASITYDASTIGQDLGDFWLTITETTMTLDGVEGVSALQLLIEPNPNLGEDSAVFGATLDPRIIPKPGITPGG